MEHRYGVGILIVCNITSPLRPSPVSVTCLVEYWGFPPWIHLEHDNKIHRWFLAKKIWCLFLTSTCCFFFWMITDTLYPDIPFELVEYNMVARIIVEFSSRPYHVKYVYLVPKLFEHRVLCRISFFDYTSGTSAIWRLDLKLNDVLCHNVWNLFKLNAHVMTTCDSLSLRSSSIFFFLLPFPIIL